jgi:hypothetical protein
MAAAESQTQPAVAPVETSRSRYAARGKARLGRGKLLAASRHGHGRGGTVAAHGRSNAAHVRRGSPKHLAQVKKRNV